MMLLACLLFCIVACLLASIAEFLIGYMQRALYLDNLQLRHTP